MKKKVVSLLMSSVLMLSVGAVASADSSPATTVDSQSGVTITYLPPSSTDSYFASLAKEVNNGDIISPMSTDGRNLQYDFYSVTSNVWSSSNLPLSTYGVVPMHLVQTTGNSKNQADVSYQWCSKDFTVKSSAIRISNNISNPNLKVTFYDVPQGTTSKPMYLYIINHSTGGYSISGNGYTAF